MKKVVLSICMTIYNQLELVKDRLNELTKYQGDDIEIVVSDDCSADDIKSLADSYGDNRIRYTRLEKNSGHDFNIIHAIKNASGDFVLILRSRDRVPDKCIDAIIKRLKENRKAAYILFSAMDEDGKEKMMFSDKRYRRGREAVLALEKLFRHPSGQIYNRACLNLEQVEKHIRCCIKTKFGFQAHILLRMQLAEKGDILTFSDVGWVYVNTSKAVDVAQNSSGTGISVYAPRYEYLRYRCEFTYVSRYVSDIYRYLLYKDIVKRYYRSVIIDFPVHNRDICMQHHYNYKQIDFSEKKEWIIFQKKSGMLFRMDKQYTRCLFIYLYSIRIRSLEFKIRGWVIRGFQDMPWFKHLYKLVKKI